jgi:hypothetical protein
LLVLALREFLRESVQFKVGALKRVLIGQLLEELVESAVLDRCIGGTL